MVFEVKDTGIGIPKNQHELIFQAFTQKEGQSTSKYGGTGLGLTITKRLVEMMNGSITLESEEGKGSVFSVFLPSVAVPETFIDLSTEEKIEDIENAVFDKAVIIHAEDNEVNRKLLQEFLSSYDFTIYEAADGQAAIDLTKELDPQLILMDIHMPKMDGIRAAEYIREFNKSVPIIALTASLHNMSSNIHNHLFNYCLKKPYSKYELLQQISYYLKYKITNENHFAQKKSNINIQTEDELIIKVPEDMAKYLSDEIMNEWEGVCEGMMIDEILLFAEKVRNFGDEHQINVLSHYGDDLYDAADSFKVVKINKLLTQFPELISKII